MSHAFAAGNKIPGRNRHEITVWIGLCRREAPWVLAAAHHIVRDGFLPKPFLALVPLSLQVTLPDLDDRIAALDKVT